MQHPSCHSYYNKETGEPTQLIDGSTSLLPAGPPPPWEHIGVEHLNCLAYENPEIIISKHLVCMKTDGGKQVAEQRESGVWKSYQFTYGDIVIHPKGEVRKWRSDEPHDVIILSLADELIQQIAADLGNKASQSELMQTIGAQDDFLRGCLYAILHESNTGFVGGALYGDTIASALAVHLVSRYSSNSMYWSRQDGGLSRKMLQVTTDYIKCNHARTIKLSELAGLTHLSPYHFARLFKQSTGMAPHQYVMHWRVQRARELLLDNEKTLKEVAREVGFYDASHLTRVFKKVTGSNPINFAHDRKG